MKPKLPSIAGILIFVVIAVVRIATQSIESDFDHRNFGRIPVLHDGRAQPLDSVARNALRKLHGKELVKANGATRSAIEWMCGAFANPDHAKNENIFKVSNRDLKALLWRESASMASPPTILETIRSLVLGPDSRPLFVSFNDLYLIIDEIRAHARAALKYSPQKRSQFEHEVIRLSQNYSTFQSIVSTFPSQPDTTLQNTLDRILALSSLGMESLKQREERKPFDQAVYDEFSRIGFSLQMADQRAFFKALPVASGSELQWITMGEALQNALRTGKVDTEASLYIEVINAYHIQNSQAFNNSISKLLSQIRQSSPRYVSRSMFESINNQIDPYFLSALGYALAFIPALISWMRKNRGFRQAALAICYLAFLVHSYGIVSSVFLFGKNFFSATQANSMFLSWISVFISLLLILKFRSAIGVAATILVGLAILALGHYEQTYMLYSHKETIIASAQAFDALSYSIASNTSIAANFVTGSLAAVLILFGLFTNTLNTQSRVRFTEMVYFSLWIATIASFATLAVHSLISNFRYGYLWQWKPSETSTLLCLMWNIIILICKRNALIKTRGLMALVTFCSGFAAWSWLGIRMLDIPQRSQDLPAEGLRFLLIFVILHLAIMLLGLIPRKTTTEESQQC